MKDYPLPHQHLQKTVLYLVKAFSCHGNLWNTNKLYRYFHPRRNSVQLKGNLKEENRRMV